MAICYSCRSVRLGDRNDGNTLIEALDAIHRVSMMVPAMAYQMMETIIPQAKTGGVCQNCISDLQYLKSELGSFL